MKYEDQVINTLPTFDPMDLQIQQSPIHRNRAQIDQDLGGSSGGTWPGTSAGIAG